MKPDNPISRNHRTLALAGLIGLNLIVGAVGGIATSSSVNGWYRTLTKPDFNPPDFIFAPVWTLLYVLTAIAAWRIWRTQNLQRTRALQLYGLQLACNFLWSPLFFGLRNPKLALADLAVMLLAVVLSQVLFWRIDRSAGWLWLPYSAWVGFATVLNTAIVVLN